MFYQLAVAIRALLLLIALTGVAYPVCIWALGQICFPVRANGSLVQVGGIAKGSELIGQEFTQDVYLWGRPSATSPRPYTPFDPATGASSTGSNLAPNHPKLLERAAVRRNALLEADRRFGVDPIPAGLPVDLLTASGSGLDPHVSLAGARVQTARIARARNLDFSIVERVLSEATTPPILGLIGEPVVSVLQVNLTLDTLSHHR